jgi:selenocysteine-specific elongation factor
VATPDAGEVTLTAAFVDVPGHERFVGTMLAGTGPVPAALLVVAADDGWSAQTQEHVEVLDLLGVPGVAVAVTKVDLVSTERRDEVSRDVERRLHGTSLAGAPIVAVDGPRGTGVPALARLLAVRLAARPAPADLGRPRLWVDRVFPVRGAGTVVTGTLGEGAVRVGDAMRVLPLGTEVRVRALESLGRGVEVAPPGTRVAVNLAGVDRDGVGRGDALVGGGPWRTTSTVDAVVRALPGRTVDRAGAWRVHVGSTAVTAQVRPLTDPVAGDGVGAVRLLLDAPLPLVAGDRLVLREGGRRRTVAGGQVADPQPGPPPRGRAAPERRVAGLLAVAAATTPAARLRALLALDGGARPGVPALAAAGLAGARPRPAGITAVGEHAVLAEVLERWAEAVLAAGAAAGSAADRTSLAAAAVSAGSPRAVADRLPDHLVADGRLVRTTGGFTTPGGAAEVRSDQQDREDRLIEALLATPFSPPDLTATAQELGIDHREVNRLVQAGAIVRAGNVAFAADAVRQAVEALRGLEAAVGPFTAAQARTAWGTTRRYAIPLLERLDATRVTRFDGHVRTLRR